MTGPRIVTVDDVALDAASEQLASGGLVVMPTETVYGLAGSTCDPGALEKIYRLKGRPENNPLIAHVLGAEEARGLVHGWNDCCDQLAERFWPGPLTIILQRDESVPSLASGGLETLAVRSPSHPVARALLTRFGHPISAPSANRSGDVSPTCAEHVLSDYLGVEEAGELMVLDGGPCDVGIESTVLDLSGPDPRILRPGILSTEDLAKVIGNVSFQASGSQDNSPGTATSHYAPRTPMELLNRTAIEQQLESGDGQVAALLFGGTAPTENVIILGSDPITCARKLYSALRELDMTSSNRLLVELPPPGFQWDAIRDRLQRASTQVSTRRSAGGGSSGGSS